MCPQVATKLPRIDIQNCKQLKLAAPNTEPHEQLTALRSALHSLTHIQSTHTELILENFTISNELSADLNAIHTTNVWGALSLKGVRWPAGVVLTPRLPPLFKFQNQLTLTDTFLGFVRDSLTSATQVAFKFASLETTWPEDTAWPWQVGLVCTR